MIRKIELSNFMSHVQTTVEPAPGLTVIAGPNNCGKSAILQAVYACVRYVRGDFMVRHGCKTASVTVTMADGTRIGFRRSGNSTFVLNEVEGLAHNADNAAKAAAAARLSEVGDETADVHFAMQKTPIFLLDDPGSHKARFFASSSDAGKLLRMKAKLKNRDQQDKETVKRTTAELLRVQTQIAALEPIEEMALRLEELEARRQEILGAAGQIRALAEAIEGIDQGMRQQKGIEAMLEPLARLHAAPVQLEDAPLAQTLRDMEEACTACEQLAAVQSCMGALQPPPVMRDESPLVALGLDLRDALGIMQSAEKQVGLMAELRAPPEESGEGATELKEMVEELLEEQEQMTQLESELAGVTAEESKAGAAVALRQREMGKCPLCGAAFEEGHEHPGRGEINS